jgi:hypothetical protein
MPVTKKVLPKRACPICKRKFRPRTKWQKYDNPNCTKAAFDLRIQAKLRRLEQLEAQGVA